MLNAVDIVCNHYRAVDFFIESLDSNGTERRMANPVDWPLLITSETKQENQHCNDKTCAEMGINADLHAELKNRFKKRDCLSYYVDTKW